MKKIQYDQETEILTITLKNTKSVDSEVSGDAVVDYDKNGNIARLELMKFSLDAFSRVKPHLKELARQQA